MKLKKSFLIYADWEQNSYAALRRAKGKAVFGRHGLRDKGEDISDALDEVTAMCFSFMKSQIKRDAEKYEAVTAKNSENGKKGGRPKKSGRGEENKKSEKPGESEKSEGFFEKPKKADNDNDKDNDNVNDNDTDNDNEKEPQKNSGGGRFEEFWREYPKKQNVVRARKAFEFLAPDGDTFEKIMQSVRHFKKSENWQKEGGRYIPSPANFLLDRRFEDVPESESKNTNRVMTLMNILKGDSAIIFESLSKNRQPCRVFLFVLCKPRFCSKKPFVNKFLKIS